MLYGLLQLLVSAVLCNLLMDSGKKSPAPILLHLLRFLVLTLFGNPQLDGKESTVGTPCCTPQSVETPALSRSIPRFLFPGSVAATTGLLLAFSNSWS